MSDLLMGFLERTLLKVEAEDLPEEIRVCPTNDYEGRLIPQIAIEVIKVRLGKTHILRMAEKICAAIDSDTQSRKGQITYLVMALSKGGDPVSHREVRYGKMVEQAQIASLTDNMNALSAVQKQLFEGISGWMDDSRKQMSFVIGQSGAVNSRSERQSEALLKALLTSREHVSDLFDINLRLRADAVGMLNGGDASDSIETFKAKIAGLKDVASPLMRALAPSVATVAKAYADVLRGKRPSIDTDGEGVEEESESGSSPPSTSTKSRVDAKIDPRVNEKLDEFRKAFAAVTNEEVLRMVGAVAAIDGALPLISQVLGVIAEKRKDAIFTAAEGVFHAMPE